MDTEQHEGESVKISFGSTYEGEGLNEKQRYVIVDLETGNHFIACPYWYQEGKLLVASAASSDVTNIGRVLNDRFSLAEIIEGLNNHIGPRGASMEQIRVLTRNAGVRERTITK